jgi:hypothetical protein
VASVFVNCVLVFAGMAVDKALKDGERDLATMLASIGGGE